MRAFQDVFSSKAYTLEFIVVACTLVYSRIPTDRKIFYFAKETASQYVTKFFLMSLTGKCYAVVCICQYLYALVSFLLTSTD